MAGVRELLLIGGSLRAQSTNGALLATAAELLGPGWTAIRYDGLGRLPHFNPDDDIEPLDPAVADLRARIGRADAVLLSTPEYAGALPGSFKNLLDWTVGGGEMVGQPVAYVNVAGPGAPTGAAGTHAALRTVLGYVSAELVEAACARIPLVRQEVGPDGLIADPALRRAIAAAVAALTAHVALESR